ncbi:MAG: hypothetical protein ACW972_08490 [Promethearchaeota archaeon]|jgi:hypothetical protein
MSNIVKIKNFFRLNRKSHQSFEVRDREEKTDVKSDVRSDADLEAKKKIVSEEQRAHMLRGIANRELNRSSMRRFI